MKKLEIVLYIVIYIVLYIVFKSAVKNLIIRNAKQKLFQ